MREPEWGRLYLDKSEASREALVFLRDAGLRIITLPVNGSVGPELRLGRETVQGLQAIKQLITEVIR